MFTQLWRDSDPATKSDLLRYRFRLDVAGFAKWCWPDLFPLPWNAFHRQVLDQVDDGASERAGRDIRRAIAAPRGIAKTTTAKARVVHALVYDLDRYVVVLSATQQLAVAITKHLRDMFSDTESELASLFGPFEVSGGVQEWSVRFPDGRRAGVLARSFGTQIRGTNLGGQRPTRILIDDGERPDRVRNPVQRQIWQDFLTKDVQKAGPKEGGLVIEWLGTVLHPDAVLARLLANPAWDGQRWQAMIRWPDRSDLWERCREIWSDLTLGDLELRQACARAFYEANREEMDRGAEVLDPVAEPLFRLFEYIWSDGLAAFLSEKQNEPKDPSAALFNSTRFARCKVVETSRGRAVINANGKVVLLQDCRISARWDPSLGLPDGDFACIVVLARDKDRYGYVLACWLKKLKPTQQLVALWELAEEWNLHRASLETNGFQAMIAEEFRRQRAEREASGRFYQLAVDEEPSTISKEERIGGLEPSIENRWLQFAEGIPTELFGQFDAFPSGDHDDGPDAVEGAWARSGASPPRLVQGRLT